MAHKVVYDALIKKYEADIADASAKITILMTDTRIIPEHIDITGEIDKLLSKISSAEDKLAVMRQHYGKKETDKTLF